MFVMQRFVAWILHTVAIEIPLVIEIYLGLKFKVIMDNMR